MTTGSSLPPRRDAVRLKNARKLSTSSQRWLQRQLNDPYVAAAKAQGWRSRAAFKLIELDEKYHLIAKGARVLDLGAAPGGWSQVALARGAASGRSGIDLLPIEPVAGAEFIQGDFLEEGMEQRLDGAARRQGRPRALGHGAQHLRPCRHRPYSHHGPGRDGAGLCLRYPCP